MKDAPPVFADDIPHKLHVRVFADRSTATAFERTSAPVLSAAASESGPEGKKHYTEKGDSSSWQPTAATPGMYVTTAMGGGISDAQHVMQHANGTRKLTSKRMVKSTIETHSRPLATLPSASTSSVDRRIHSFAGSFAAFVPRASDA